MTRSGSSSGMRRQTTWTSTLRWRFEAHDAEKAERPVGRWQLGDPGASFTGGVPADSGGPQPRPESWPWNPDHPDHERFVGEFFDTYTEQAVRVARIAEEEGAGMYSLGTETDRLFRTRPGGEDWWTNDFRSELQAMVQRVRAVYDGLLTYDMHARMIRAEPDFQATGSDCLWVDLDLDVVGISAWFDLVDTEPTQPMTLAQLDAAFEERFREDLLPLARRSSGRPIIFTEFGSMDVVTTPRHLGTIEGQGDLFERIDVDGNGIDDGRETQANIAQALFNTMEQHPGLVEGIFW